MDDRRKARPSGASSQRLVGAVTEFLSFLVAGIVFGAIYAVSASGLVVTYNTTGIFNFAHGAMGMVLAYVFWQLWQGWGLPELVSLALDPLRGGALARDRRRTGRHAPSVRGGHQYPARRHPRPAARARRPGRGGVEPDRQHLRHAGALERQPDLGGRHHPVVGAAHHGGGGHRGGGLLAGVLPTHPHGRGHARRRGRPGPGIALRGALRAHLGLRLDDRRDVRRPGWHPARPQRAGDEHPDADPARDLRLCRGGGGSSAQPSHDVPGCDDPGRGQLHGHRLRPAGGAQRRGRRPAHGDAVPGAAPHPRGAPGHRPRGARAAATGGERQDDARRCRGHRRAGHRTRRRA